MTDRRIVTARRLGDDQLTDVLRLVDAVTEVDRVRPLDEQAMLHVRYGGDSPARNVLLYSEGELAGYAHLDLSEPAEGPSAQLTVAPSHRERGHGRALTGELLAQSPTGDLRLWSHGNHPAAAKLAGQMGFTRIRALWQMRRSLADALPEPELPADVRVRSFVPEQDEQAWVGLNARAFADHPEQGGWTVEELRLREHEPWFDPAGFFLAERRERLLGFHWTKVHGGGDDGDSRDGENGENESIGEVYVVGVDPAGRGLGLGRALTLVGLRHLRERGLTHAMLYVDESNDPAIRLYESLGFRHWDTDVMFRHAPG